MTEKNLKKIAIWGTGKLGREYYLKLKNVYDVVAFYDSDVSQWGKQIDGVPIIKFENQTEFVVIASIGWRDIKDVLEQHNLKIIKNFMPWWMFQGEIVSLIELRSICTKEELKEWFAFIKENKKIAVVYGNCQTRMISKMLMFHDDFKKQYIILDIPLIYEFNNYPEGLDKEIAKDDGLWLNVDLFIYQKISINNRLSREMSTENLLTRVKEECKKVCIVNIYFDGYFPQSKRLEIPLTHSIMGKEYFLYEDEFLRNEIEKIGCKNIDKILEVISDEKYLEEEEIFEKCNKSIVELKKREEAADVNIADYIEKYYREEQLFFSFDHPNNRVLFEYTNRILNYLRFTNNRGISEVDMLLHFGTLKSADMLIYPCILKTLGLKQYENYYYVNRGVKLDCLYDFETYQRRYIEYRWKESVEGKNA